MKEEKNIIEHRETQYEIFISSIWENEREFSEFG